jgi:hypothetical protein
MMICLQVSRRSNQQEHKGINQLLALGDPKGESLTHLIGAQ